MPYLERVAINVPVSSLVELEEEIKEHVEDTSHDFADDVFNALVIGSIIAASNGYWKMSGTTSERILACLRVLPDTASKSKLLRNTDNLLALISAY